MSSIGPNSREITQSWLTSGLLVQNSPKCGRLRPTSFGEVARLRILPISQMSTKLGRNQLRRIRPKLGRIRPYLTEYPPKLSSVIKPRTSSDVGPTRARFHRIRPMSASSLNSGYARSEHGRIRPEVGRHLKPMLAETGRKRTKLSRSTPSHISPKLGQTPTEVDEAWSDRGQTWPVIEWRPPRPHP